MSRAARVCISVKEAEDIAERATGKQEDSKGPFFAKILLNTPIFYSSFAGSSRGVWPSVANGVGRVKGGLETRSFSSGQPLVCTGRVSVWLKRFTHKWKKARFCLRIEKMGHS